MQPCSRSMPRWSITASRQAAWSCALTLGNTSPWAGPGGAVAAAEEIDAEHAERGRYRAPCRALRFRPTSPPRPRARWKTLRPAEMPPSTATTGASRGAGQPVGDLDARQLATEVQRERSRRGPGCPRRRCNRPAALTGRSAAAGSSEDGSAAPSRAGVSAVAAPAVAAGGGRRGHCWHSDSADSGCIRARAIEARAGLPLETCASRRRSCARKGWLRRPTPPAVDQGSLAATHLPATRRVPEELAPVRAGWARWLPRLQRAIPSAGLDERREV